MKTKLIIAASAMLFASLAQAADIPVKAPPASVWLNGYPYATSGPYFGFFTDAGGGPVVASVPGVNPASLTTTTAEIGGVAGYAWGSKNSPFAYSLEGKVAATNFNGANQGFSVAGPVSAEGTALVWMPVSLIQNAISTLNIPNPFSTIPPFPANPAGITASNLQAGFGAGFRAEDVTIAYLGVGSNKVWKFSPKIEFDLMEQLSNGSAVREYVETVFEANGAMFGANQSKATQGTKYLAGVMWIW
jgi:opacity protein-like surface antigen